MIPCTWSISNTETTGVTGHSAQGQQGKVRSDCEGDRASAGDGETFRS